MPEPVDVVVPDPDTPGAEVRIGPWPSRSAAQYLARAVSGRIEAHDAACETVAHRRVHRRETIDSPEALRAWIAQHGYTADTLAEALGRARSTVYHWLSGARPIPVDLGLRLAALPPRR